MLIADRPRLYPSWYIENAIDSRQVVRVSNTQVSYWVYNTTRWKVNTWRHIIKYTYTKRMSGTTYLETQVFLCWVHVKVQGASTRQITMPSSTCPRPVCSMCTVFTACMLYSSDTVTYLETNVGEDWTQLPCDSFLSHFMCFRTIFTVPSVQICTYKLSQGTFEHWTFAI